MMMALPLCRVYRVDDDEDHDDDDDANDDNNVDGEDTQSCGVGDTDFSCHRRVTSSCRTCRSVIVRTVYTLAKRCIR